MRSSPDLSFLRNRTVLKEIFIVTLAFAVAALLYGFLAPKWYRSSLTVVSSSHQGGGVASLIGAENLGLAASLGASLGGSADGARIAAVLQSVAVSDAVIEKFDLLNRYDEKYQENARDELWRHCDVKVLPKPNLVQLSCEDKDPHFIREMLAYFADYGNQVFRRVSVSSASEEVRFLEKRVAELRLQADDAASQMRSFQEQYKIVDLDTQAKAVVSVLSSLNSQRITKQMELDYARTFSANDEETMQQLRSQLSVMGEKLRDLEEPAGSPPSIETQTKLTRNGGNAMFPAALSVPKLRAEFAKLYRENKVAEATLIFALERLEGAKANEARDVSTFQVLDPPTVPTKKSRPQRLVILAIVTGLGLAASFGYQAWRAGLLAYVFGID